MKKITFLLMFLVTFSTWSQEYSRVKILTNNEGLKKLGDLGVTIDHGTHKEDVFYISDFSAREIEIMQENGFNYEILIADVQQFYRDQNKNGNDAGLKNAACTNAGGTSGFTPTVPSNFNLGSMGGFFTYQEFLNEIDQMAALYPNLITVKAPISSFLTHEGRPIYWLKISDNPNQDENEPEVLYSSIHHAREPASLSQTIFYMWYLLENYGSSEEIAYLVNNTEMYFVPVINPDGYNYNATTEPTGGGMWRKNRRNNGNGTFGVDLNRNYSYGWGTTGTSTNPSNDTYCGTAPFSEPETQAIKWFCENRDFQLAFNAHTYSDLILFPIGTTDNEFAEDHDYFQALTDHMVEFNGYIGQKSSGLYPASGDSDDYMYKVDLTIKPEIFAMTPEIGGDEDGFWPAQSAITGICQEMIFPNLVLSHMTHRYYIVKDTDPSSIETLTGSFNHSAYRLGFEDGTVSVSITPLTGIQSVGAAASYNLNAMQSQDGAISYVLNPDIQFGDEIKYVLETVYQGWTKRDTITKTFGALTLQISDDASTNANWTGTWSTTTSTFVSPSRSFTDSPTGDYANNSTRTYLFNDTIDLTNATAAQISFYAKWEIENNYDYARMEVSTNFGSTWIGQCGLYTNTGTSANGSVQPNGEPVYDGTQASWVLEEINLSDYLGQKIFVRFILKADGGTRGDGFYFDDFNVSFNEADPNASIAELDMTIKAVPNPANEKVIISLGNPISKGTILWFDASGKQVGSQTIHEITNKVEINTSNLPNGFYTVRLVNSELNTNVCKMIIAH
jgi:hypothetical protein